MMSVPTHSPNANRLLIADTDTEALRLAAVVAAKLGYAVASASNEAQFCDEVTHFAPTVILIDPQVLGANAFDPLRWLGVRLATATLILTSAQDPIPLTPEEVNMAYGLEVSSMLRKPLDEGSLATALTPTLNLSRRISEADLRRAVDRAQLCTHYQPRMRRDADGWSITGVEALLRWNHPEYGLIFPQEFIGVAEEHGLIGALTDFVLQDGIDCVSGWNRAGRRLGLSVNLSPKLFTDVDFADRMSEFLWNHGVAPEQLTLEITESAALNDPSGTLEILSRLRARGIGLALDDFGIGYSSLTQLYKLPFSEVKIDKAIGMEIPQTPAARMIVRAIVDLGHHLGLAVCCEGVESKIALDLLHKCGCDHAQGYFIARPMPAEDLSRWIDAHGGAAALRAAS